MYFYFLMNEEQLSEVNSLLNSFKQSKAKNKQLYEVTFNKYDLSIFERPSNRNTLCIERKVLRNLKDPCSAEQAIKTSWTSGGI